MFYKRRGGLGMVESMLKLLPNAMLPKVCNVDTVYILDPMPSAKIMDVIVSMLKKVILFKFVLDFYLHFYSGVF